MSAARTIQDDLDLKPLECGDELAPIFLNELVRRIKELERRLAEISPEIK